MGVGRNMHLGHHVFAFVSYLALCFAATLFVKPVSVIHFIGPAGALTSAFVIVWGARSLYAVVAATIAFAYGLKFVELPEANLAIFLVALMAIALQAFWARQLIHRYLPEQKWLNSRRRLFSFLIRIGPMASVVSGSATVLAAVLDTNLMASSLSFAFFSGWSASVLLALFFVPALLFFQGEQRLSLSKRLFVVVASTLGCASIALLLVMTHLAHQHQRFDRFAYANSTISNVVDDELKMIEQKVNALSALFSASEVVTAEEFELFTKNVFKENSTLRALQWVPAVSLEEKQRFENFTGNELGFSYQILEQSVMGDLQPADDRAMYLPVMFLYPYKHNMASLGVDLLEHKDKSQAMYMASQKGTIVASAPITLVQDAINNPGFLVFSPVFNATSQNKFGMFTDAGNPANGFIIAVVQFDRLFADIAQQLTGSGIAFFVNDKTTQSPYVMYGENAKYGGQLLETLVINTFSRRWEIDVFEIEPWEVQPKSWKTWLLLLGGTFGGSVYQLLILMMAAYSTELGSKVTVKTRELIVAKDVSERANDAKSKFIETLGIELKSSFEGLLAFVEQLRPYNSDTAQRQNLNAIENTAHALAHLVKNLNDINSIESGRLTIENNVMNLHDFVNDMESMFKVTAEHRQQEVSIVIGNNVPQYIHADKHRVGQILSIINNTAFAILQSDVIRISVKAHLHKVANTSIFFVVTVGEAEIAEPDSLFNLDDSNHEFESHSTAMAMVKELCQLLGGDAKVVHLPSGDSLINVSIKVDLPAAAERRKVAFTGQLEDIKPRKNKDLLVITDDEMLCNKLNLCSNDVERQLDSCNDHKELFTLLTENKYRVVFLDGNNQKFNALKLAEQIRKNPDHESLTIIGIFSQTVDPQDLLAIKSCMNGFLETPINIDKFNYYLSNS